jgi:hypothetical protein
VGDQARKGSTHGCVLVFASTGCAVKNTSHPTRTRSEAKGANPGSPFSWLLLFGEAKRSNSAAAEADETRSQLIMRSGKAETQLNETDRSSKSIAAEAAPTRICTRRSLQRGDAESRSPRTDSGDEPIAAEATPTKISRIRNGGVRRMPERAHPRHENRSPACARPC